ncbi:serine/threonine-protein kinase [Stigmatella aurantiaca]|uniref:Protein kinase n=1 Tax=Stigmatella aurantiaca (strain DW4/3-1) TaxID=378806 RepID=Q08PX4_STIAD|nr:serine/threonine-protein kinase [Stigmatella aurantiaca]ADO74588.1 Protein kinase [Stigmatella aurantiaca DW4/3-1]EAU62541.1 protein kinase [Stigmatella aurantiaca DW4/3-1]
MDELLPEALPPGTLLGSWRVDGWAGFGTYGVVYRAHRTGRLFPQPVALKLARYPHDARFDREAELLSRIQHPGVPRLLGRGTWTRGPRRERHPYLVMQWVEGLRLYKWAEEHPLTSRQALRLLAQTARALEATHACGGLHRDIKGDNILVGPEGQVFLMDFGCGTWEGAAPLTDGLLAPGTRIYRSPQALRFYRDHLRSNNSPYPATPADDVYALGVMAYRLCTEIYPPLATNLSVVGNDGRDAQEVRVPPSQLKPLAPSLESFILRMLCDTPQDRGSAGELAAAMEAAAATAGAEADEPLGTSRSAVPPEVTRPPTAVPRRSGGIWPAALLPSAAGLLILVSGHLKLEGRWAPSSSLSDGGTGGVADAAVEAIPVSSVPREPEPSRLSLDMPKEPLPGQSRPPCPRNQISIRGGCWVEIAQDSPPCGEGYYHWKGACYFPVVVPPRPSTSDKHEN